MKYLVAPRLLAGVIAMPLLVMVADILGVLGGFIVATVKLGFVPASYIHNTLHHADHRGRGVRPGQGGGVRLHDRADGLLPWLSAAAAARRAWASATTSAVVSASILILALRLCDDGDLLRAMSASPPTGLPKIRVRGLRKAFGAKQVLDGVDLDVMPGTSMVVIGGSGTGKSVLIKCILGLIEPDAGSDRDRRASIC